MTKATVMATHGSCWAECPLSLAGDPVLGTLSCRSGVRGFPTEHLVTPEPCTSAAPLTVGVVGS